MINLPSKDQRSRIIRRRIISPIRSSLQEGGIGWTISSRFTLSLFHYVEIYSPHVRERKKELHSIRRRVRDRRAWLDGSSFLLFYFLAFFSYESNCPLYTDERNGGRVPLRRNSRSNQRSSDPRTHRERLWSLARLDGRSSRVSFRSSIIFLLFHSFFYYENHYTPYTRSRKSRKTRISSETQKRYGE